MNFYYLNTTINYPKHRGKTLKEVIDQDIDYVKWLHKNRMINWHISSWEYFLEKTGSLGGFRSVNRKRA